MSTHNRQLIVVADDYGIGPEVSRGILDLLRHGTVTGTVLLANAPHVETAMREWKNVGRPGEIGWHPNLTMDDPVAPLDQVRTLISREGKLISLGTLMGRLASGRLAYADLVRELDAQYGRCHDLIGGPPALVNGHKHVHVFPMVNRALVEVLKRWRVRPYIRRVMEPFSSWRKVPGARMKRLFLTTLGRLATRRFDREGFPGNETLAGVTDPKWVNDPQFYARWLARIPGRVVELMVHPGYRDSTLIGRDCSATDGQMDRRVAELNMLMHPEFRTACASTGFTLETASGLAKEKDSRHAA